jgi:hypothetical protein
MSEFDPRPISKAAKNERRKLMATTLNTLGLTVFGVGVITQIISEGSKGLSLLTFVQFSAILLVMHLIARRVLKGLED